MIKNNKGFMMIEVIVTATVVMTVMITFYASFSRMYSRYKVRNSYYNLDAVYATKEMIDSMFKTGDGNINSFIKNKFNNSNGYGLIIDNGVCIDGVPKSCTIFNDLYGINEMILVKYDEASLNRVKESSAATNQTFDDYIDYLKIYYDVKTTNSEYEYIVLTEIENDNDNYYASLRIR